MDVHVRQAGRRQERPAVKLRCVLRVASHPVRVTSWCRGISGEGPFDGPPEAARTSLSARRKKIFGHLDSAGRNKLMATHHYLDIMYLLNIQFNIQVVLDILATLNSSSCGLFLLNYIEYWTGDELSDSFTQDDMSHFRKKLAVILLSSCMNKRRGYPLCKYDKEVQTGSPSDVEILDSPTNHKKRKLLHMLDNSEVLMEDEDGPITQADLQRWFVDEWDKRTPTKVLTDGCTDDFLMSGLSTKDMPVTKADLIDVLCDYIMAIQDDTTLDFNPFKIEISVKDLQNILSINLDMTLKCFDMVIRLLANKESRRPKGEIIKNRKHYMDMRFWRMIGFGKLPKYHEDPTTKELTKTLDCWPSINYYITACKCSYAMEIQRFLRPFRNRSWLNTSYLILQAMAMWGNDSRMKFVR
ncbi:hypothetical protein ACJX0J_024120, partial [Zea mays]